MKYQKLFEPIQIGSLRLKNRLVMPAMYSQTTNSNHEFTDQSLAYYAARAKGGFSLIIVGYMAISPYGVGDMKEAGIWDDSFIPNLKKLTDSIHDNDAKTLAQLHHSGMMCIQKNTSVQPKGPSAIAAVSYLEKVKEYSNEEVYQLVEEFAQAALRAKKARFDGVEVHAAHQYLLAQFLSKFTNKRVDEFGGSYENRFRIVELIIKRIKEICGNDFCISLRISADEFLDAGNTPEDAIIYGKMAEDAGVDVIHVSTGSGIGGNIVTPHYYAPGFNIINSEKMKKSVSIPVIAVGRINDPVIANVAIANGRADLVSLGRQAVADPEFPNKTAEDRIDEIFQCTGCMQRCYFNKGGYDEDDYGISCVQNPFSGKEYKWNITSANKKKKISIIGAGPAGLEAGWILAKRGHEVHIYEKNEISGGTYRLAAVPPKKQDIGKTIFTLTTLCKKYGAVIHFNSEITEDNIMDLNQDVIILATGSLPIIPSIPGVNSNKVVKALDILSGDEIVANKNVLIIGGGQVGCETAEFLTIYNNNITIVEMGKTFAKDCVRRSRSVLMERLKKDQVSMLTELKVIEIQEDVVVVENKNGISNLTGFDSIVLALGARSYNPLENVAKNYCKEVYSIGDALGARDAFKAIYDGARIGMSL